MFDSCWGHILMRQNGKETKLKKNIFVAILRFWILPLLVLIPLGPVFGQEAGVAEKTEQPAPKSELDNLKAEWEAVREQQIQMIREKEEQLEKLKEEIFSKMKSQNVPAVVPAAASPAAVAEPVAPIPSADIVSAPVSNNSAELEKQKISLQAERQKFFSEMTRQKESLRRLQVSLDEKTKQLDAERRKFEQEKKAAVS